jgi:hypothetical protein
VVLTVAVSHGSACSATAQAKTLWSVKRVSDGFTLLSGTGSNTNSVQYCGDVTEVLSFNVTNTGGAGLCCSGTCGQYSVTVGSTVVATSLTESTTAFSTRTASLPLWNPVALDSAPTSASERRVCAPIVVTVNNDSKPHETAWRLKRLSDDVNIMTGASSGSSMQYCGDVGESLEFSIFDQGSNGICCGANGNGSYTVTVAGVTVAAGGVFRNMEATRFGFVAPKPLTPVSVVRETFVGRIDIPAGT